MRIRIKYSKTDPLRYSGHLDLQRSWERTLRRSRLPVVFSQGFHPQPRIQQACALPLGFTSRAEVVDVWLEGESQIVGIDQAIRDAAPPGIEILGITEVDLSAPPLQTQVLASDYRVTLLEDLDLQGLHERIRNLLASPAIPRQRRGKTYDLRPLVEDLRVDESCLSNTVVLSMRLSAREGATGRPEEVLEALGISPNDARVERIHLVFL
jgi:radical SAM-linked protein